MRSFEEILHELVQSMDNPVAAFVSKEQEIAIAKQLSEVEGLADFLKQTLGADMRRYFAATPAAQEQIKGAFSRTSYILSLAVPKKNMDLLKEDLTSPRIKNSALQTFD